MDHIVSHPNLSRALLKSTLVLFQLTNVNVSLDKHRDKFDRMYGYKARRAHSLFNQPRKLTNFILTSFFPNPTRSNESNDDNIPKTRIQVH